MKLIEVAPRANFRLFLRYDDGTSGEIDLCPDSLYMQLTGMRPEQVFPKLKDIFRLERAA